MRSTMVFQTLAAASISAPSTSDWIAIVAVILALAGAFVAFGQLSSAKATARAQFLLDMDEAFAADEQIRVRLAQRTPPLTAEEWRGVKRYMARLERVSIFVSQGLLDKGVVHRLYGSRVRRIVCHEEVRMRLLENPDRARHWVDFIELWRTLDEIELKLSKAHLCDSAKPPARPEHWEAHRTVDEDLGGEGAKV